jgi:hypothetical protein
MKVPSGPPSVSDISTLGKYFWSLWQDPSWVLRRVETVRLVDLDRTERNVTLDIDVDAVAKFAKDAGLPEGKTVVVPLALLEKGLQLDLDVKDGSGEALSLLTSEQDSHLSSAAVAHVAGSLLTAPEIFAKLYAISKHMPSQDEISQIAGRAPGPVVSWALPKDSPDPAKDQWKALFQDSTFRGAVATFTVGYTPIARLPVSASVEIVKFRYVSQGPVPNQTVGSWLGFRSTAYIVEAPSVGRAAREHLRVLAPEGTYLAEIGIWKDAPKSSGSLEPAQGSSTFDVRVSRERGALYTSGIATDDGHYTVAATLRPNLGGLGIPALITVAAAGLLTALGSIFEFREQLLSIHADSAEPVIAVFGLLFSLYSIYLSRPGEHEIRSQLLLRPRLAILGTVPFVLFAAVIFIFSDDLPPRMLAIVWEVAAILCGIVAFYLLAIVILSANASRRVRRNSHFTRTRPMFTIFTPNWDWSNSDPS